MREFQGKAQRVTAERRVLHRSEQGEGSDRAMADAGQRRLSAQVPRLSSTGTRNGRPADLASTHPGPSPFSFPYEEGR